MAKRYNMKNDSVKVQIEDLLGKNPSGGWKYQAPGQGNKGAEGAHYYYKSQTAQGSLKSAPSYGRFSFEVNVEDPGTYAIRLRASRDTNKPGDARNDIWIRVDGDTQDVMPKGTKKLTDGGHGFVKYKGAQANKWVDASQFSTPQHGDKNPVSNVVFDKGWHEITFAPRSTGYHIDSVKVYQIKSGGTASGGGGSSSSNNNNNNNNNSGSNNNSNNNNNNNNNNNSNNNGKGVDTFEIARKHDDFESNKAAASGDLEFGRDGDGKQSVGLRFSKLDLDKGEKIKAAYFVFEAKETDKGKAKFEIEIENSRNAKTYSKKDAPDDRKYLAQDVDWNVENWKKGQTYKSPDISDLIESVIKGGSADALAFRISGSGERVAYAYESGGDEPQLVIDYA